MLPIISALKSNHDIKYLKQLKNMHTSQQGIIGQPKPKQSFKITPKQQGNGDPEHNPTNNLVQNMILGFQQTLVSNNIN